MKPRRRTRARSGSGADDTGPGYVPDRVLGTRASSGADDDVDRLLSGLTRFLLRHSAEGAFELRDTVRAVARAYGAEAEILALAEGAVLTVRHPGGPPYHDTVRVGPELARLDLVSKVKFLVNRILAGNSAQPPRAAS